MEGIPVAVGLWMLLAVRVVHDLADVEDIHTLPGGVLASMDQMEVAVVEVETSSGRKGSVVLEVGLEGFLAGEDNRPAAVMEEVHHMTADCLRANRTDP